MNVSNRGHRLASNLAEINVTPLVDVMLVLLIIFMVTAPMMQSGITVNLPAAETADTPQLRWPGPHRDQATATSTWKTRSSTSTCWSRG